MSQKIICRRPAPSSETIAGEAVLPRPPAGDCGNVQPAPGCTDAKQPGETTSRLLRVVPPSPEHFICWRDFAVLRSLFSAEELPAVLLLYFFDMEQRLLNAARCRARRDFAALAQEAMAIGRIAGNIGAARTRQVASQLQEACMAGDYSQTYSLLNLLSQACDEASNALNEWLELPAARHWG